MRTDSRDNHMNTVTMVGLPMWRVSMIAWKRRSEKRLSQLMTELDRSFDGAGGDIFILRLARSVLISIFRRFCL
jgi:hypothetical protein